jgi:hypothetical protein
MSNSLTRFAVIDDERNLMLGKDNDGIFEKGVVYEAIKILDSIVLRPIGEYALPSKDEGLGVTKYSTINDMSLTPMHLYTKEEMKKRQKYFDSKE